jgi:hypothetical protein
MSFPEIYGIDEYKDHYDSQEPQTEEQADFGLCWCGHQASLHAFKSGPCWGKEGPLEPFYDCSCHHFDKIEPIEEQEPTDEDLSRAYEQPSAQERLEEAWKIKRGL